MAARKRIPPSGGSIEQRVRLVSGLVLFTFAFFHFLNHALGNISLAAMEWGQTLRYAVTHSLVGEIVLYSAFLVHPALGLWKTVRRQTWRMPIWEAIQIILGLLIPFVLIKHIFATRGAELAFGSYIDYRHELSILWPESAVWQSGLLVIVWLHGCIGIHYWLRLKPWYERYTTPLICLATLIPLLALTGWISAARRLVLENATRINVSGAETAYLVAQMSHVRNAFYLLVGLMLLFVAVRYLVNLRRKRITIQYLNSRTVRTSPGPTLLEISRMKGLPHMSICGGRARCSTCRTLILSGEADLSKPSETEAMVLKRIGAGINVRLACQIRPTSDMVVRPLMAAARGFDPEGLADHYRWGVEQPVVVMFADLRGFTSLSEGKLPFDVVFILNRYVDGAVRSIERNGGMVDKIMGDGIMALFGVKTSLAEGTKAALTCLNDLQVELERINDDLSTHLNAPLRIAIGLHGGTAILGRIGLDGRNGVSSGLTALGDVVNVASRLEGVAKQENALAAVSMDLVQLISQTDHSNLQHRSIMIRGRQTPLDVLCLYGREDFFFLQ